MVSRHLVDPELDALLDTFPPFKLSPENLPALRKMQAETFEQIRSSLPTFDDVEETERIQSQHDEPNKQQFCGNKYAKHYAYNGKK